MDWRISDENILAYLPRQRVTFDALLPERINFDSAENHRAFQKFGRLLRAPRCPFCRTDLRRSDSGGTALNRGVGIAIAHCAGCGWWCCERVDTPVGGEIGDDFSEETWGYAFLDSTLARFRVDDVAIPVQVLRDHIYKHPSSLNHIHPRKCEELVASIFRDFFSCTVHLTGYSVDGGVDVYLVDGDNQYLIQVKRRRSANAIEGVQAIRELAGVLLISGHTRGIVVTTAAAYSRTAKREANSELLNARGYSISLVNASELLNRLRVVMSRQDFHPYWHVLLRRPFWDSVNEIVRPKLE